MRTEKMCGIKLRMKINDNYTQKYLIYRCEDIYNILDKILTLIPNKVRFKIWLKKTIMNPN